MTTEPQLPGVLATRLAEKIPPQRAFAWNRDKWRPVVRGATDAETVLETLPDELDRQVVRDVVQANLSLDRVLGAFVPVLIWGGPGGFGPFRARSILTGVRTRANADAPVDEAIRERLLEGSKRIRKPGAAEAFQFMNNDGKIKYLGGAFFSKWLSFSSMVGTVDGDEVAPILDKRVRDWISHHTSDGERVNLNPRSTRDYLRYLELLDAWGAPSERTKAQVELAIFELTRDRPADA